MDEYAVFIDDGFDRVFDDKEREQKSTLRRLERIFESLASKTIAT